MPSPGSNTGVGINFTADDESVGEVIKGVEKQLDAVIRKATEATEAINKASRSSVTAENAQSGPVRPPPRIIDTTIPPTAEEAAERTRRASENQAVRQAELDADTRRGGATPDVRPVDKDAAKEAATLQLRNDLELDMIHALELEAEGRTAAADALRDEVKAMELALDLQKRLGLGEDEAIDAAQRQVGAQRQIANNKAQQVQSGKQQGQQLSAQAALMHQVARTFGMGPVAALFGGGGGGTGGGPPNPPNPPGGGGGGGMGMVTGFVTRNPIKIVTAGLIAQEHQMNKEREFYNNEEDRNAERDRRARSLKGGEVGEQLGAAGEVSERTRLLQRESDQEYGVNTGILGIRHYKDKGVLSNIGGNISNRFKNMFGFDSDSDKAERQKTAIDTEKMIGEGAGKQAVRLSSGHTEALRLETLGYADQALNIERNIALKNEEAKIDAIKGLSPEDKIKLKDNAARADALKYAIKPQAAVGDSMTSEGGGGGSFGATPGAGAAEEVVHTSLLTEIRDLLKPPAYAGGIVSPN
jgi:hypothetical protein